MDIGEEKREIIVVPIEVPAQEPGNPDLAPVPATPVVPTEPAKEPVGV